MRRSTYNLLLVLLPCCPIFPALLQDELSSEEGVIWLSLGPSSHLHFLKSTPPSHFSFRLRIGDKDLPETIQLSFLIFSWLELSWHVLFPSVTLSSVPFFDYGYLIRRVRTVQSDLSSPLLVCPSFLHFNAFKAHNVLPLRNYNERLAT